MDYSQSLAIWFAMKSMRERGAPGKATPSQPEEVFVPFNLPPLPQRQQSPRQRRLRQPWGEQAWKGSPQSTSREGQVLWSGPTSVTTL